MHTTMYKHGYHLKVPDPISQNGDFYSNDASSPMKSWFQISGKSVEPFRHKKRLRILQLPIPPFLMLIMVTITSHILINIFQTVHFSSIKFTRGNEKHMTFLLIPKSLKFGKKSEAIGPGSFNNFQSKKCLLLVIMMPVGNHYVPVFLHYNGCRLPS